MQIAAFAVVTRRERSQSREEGSELLQVTLRFFQPGLDKKAKHALQHLSSQKQTVIIIVWAVENQRWCKESLHGGKVYSVLNLSVCWG
jgi:hypothetical protein